MSRLIVMLLLALTPAIGGDADLGELQFPTSASEMAQEQFYRGVLYLHSFEYADARTAFKEASRIQPTFAMAYWGEAMTHNHPLWNQTDPVAARAALNRLADTPQKRQAAAPTAREKGYLAAVELLYAEGKPKPARDLAYASAMASLSAAFPDDLEAAAFHALSILGTAQAKRDFRIYMRAGAIAQAVFAKNPRHPGAAHYVIHSFDDPIHAPLGLPAAEAYAAIAPDAPHALHMPSHIFMALGMWENAVNSNVASNAATVKKNGGLGYHALYWLAYAYSQQGRFGESAAVVAQVKEKLPSKRARRHLALMRASYLSETNQWREQPFPDDFDISDINMSAAASALYANGMHALQKGESQKAMGFHDQILKLPESSAQYSDMDSRPIIAMELEAMIALDRGDWEKALGLLAHAVSKTENMSYEFGPPIPVKPVHELYGDLLLHYGDATKAMTAYRGALSRDPLRPWSLKGLVRAARKAGDEKAAAEAENKLRSVSSKADQPVSF